MKTVCQFGLSQDLETCRPVSEDTKFLPVSRNQEWVFLLGPRKVGLSPAPCIMATSARWATHGHSYSPARWAFTSRLHTSNISSACPSLASDSSEELTHVSVFPSGPALTLRAAKTVDVVALTQLAGLG